MKTRGGKPVGKGMPCYRIEFAAQVEKLCALGATTPQLADFFGVSEAAIYQWRRNRAEFDRAVKVGKERAKGQVETSLFRRATGYTIEIQKVVFPVGSRTPVVVPVEERVPPDAYAALAWLRTCGPERAPGKRGPKPKTPIGDDPVAAEPANIRVDLPDNGRG